MKLGGMGWIELLIILVVVLLIFGPKNLPKIGKSLGKTVKNVRDGISGKGEDAAVAEATVEEVPAPAAAEGVAAVAEVVESADAEVAKDLSWTCSCGTVNTGKFCNECGQPASVVG